eukprot:gene29714-35873_t
MGGSMVACVGLVLLAQNTQDKKDKGNYMFYHNSFGLLAAGLLAPRLLLRITSKTPGPVVNQRPTGDWHAYFGFGLPSFYTTIPSIEKKPEIAKQTYNIHKLMGQAFEYAVPLHAGALQRVVRVNGSHPAWHGLEVPDTTFSLGCPVNGRGLKDGGDKEGAAPVRQPRSLKRNGSVLACRGAGCVYAAGDELPLPSTYASVGGAVLRLAPHAVLAKPMARAAMHVATAASCDAAVA